MSTNNDQLTKLASFQDLLVFLEQEGVPFKPELEQRKIEIPAQLDELSSSLYLLWGDDVRPFVQCVCPLPFSVSEDRVSAIESSIVRLNHTLDIGGFGLNHANYLLYYRTTLPLRSPDNTLLAREIKILCRSTVQATAKFYPLLKKIALEQEAPETVLSI